MNSCIISLIDVRLNPNLTGSTNCLSSTKGNAVAGDVWPATTSGEGGDLYQRTSHACHQSSMVRP